MAEKKWTKWIVGLSSVLAFTGFLYVTQKDYLDVKNYGATKIERGLAERNINFNEYKVSERLQDLKAEIFLIDEQKMEEIMGWSYEQKLKREQLLERLNWDDDPDFEITLSAPKDGIGQYSLRSNVRTRRS